MSSVAPLVVKPRAACLMLGCSHKKLYQLLAERKLESFKDGYSRKITVESINTYVADRIKASRSEKLRRPT